MDKKYYPYVLLFWLAIFVSPRGLLGGGVTDASNKIRIEDFLIPVWITYFLNREKEASKIIGIKLNSSIMLWIFYITIFTFANAILMNFPIINGFIFVGKEFQFVLYFYFFSVFAYRNPRFTIISFTISTIPIFLFSFYQYFQGDFTGYYGIQLPWEVGVSGGASSEIGAITAILFITFFVFTLNKNLIPFKVNTTLNIGIIFFTLTALVIVVLTISKSNIIGALVAVLIILLSRISLGIRGTRSIILVTILGLFAYIIISSIPLFDSIINRFIVLFSYALPDRIGGWKMLLEFQFKDVVNNMSAIFFGYGLSSPGYLLEGKYYSLSLGVDNQYIRRLFEVGIIGTFIWIKLLFNIGNSIKQFAKKTNYYLFFREFILGLFVLLMFAGVGLEVLQVIRIASTFYSLMGILLGLSYYLYRENIVNAN